MAESTAVPDKLKVTAICIAQYELLVFTYKSLWFSPKNAEKPQKTLPLGKVDGLPQGCNIST